MAIDKVGHVKTQISMNQGKLRPKYEAQHVKICCPFHAGGNERTPSCSVRLTGNVGGFQCFGCHEKGNWNKLAEATGMQGFKRSDQVNDVFMFSIPEENYARKAPNLEDLEYLKPYAIKSGWRNITLDTMKLFEAKYPKHRFYHQDDFVYFPVKIGNNYVGGVYARRNVTIQGKEDGELSYINTKGVWSRKTLFGFNLAKKRRGPLWYVEGPRDCMKVAQLGGRVVSGLGAYVGPEKIRLIERIDPPCVIIATDPDAAGDKARAYLKQHLTMLPTLDAEFPEGRDPGNFTQRSYNKMLKKLGLGEYIVD